MQSSHLFQGPERGEADRSDAGLTTHAHGPDQKQRPDDCEPWRRLVARRSAREAVLIFARLPEPHDAEPIFADSSEPSRDGSSTYTQRTYGNTWSLPEPVERSRQGALFGRTSESLSTNGIVIPWRFGSLSRPDGNPPSRS